MPDLQRTLSFGSIAADLSRCGVPVDIRVVTTAKKSESSSTKSHSRKKSSLLGNGVSLTRENLSMGKSMSEGRLKMDGFYNKSLRRKQLTRFRHQAFPFGTSEFPFQPKRLGGGSVNATTKVFSLKTKTPMGSAGIREMYMDAAFTHKGTYAVFLLLI